MDELGVILPPGVNRPAPVSEGLPSGRGLIVNETDLPDALVQAALEDRFVEQSSMIGANSPSTFDVYTGYRGGSLLTRGKLRSPTNVVEEIVLARDLAERDDDVGSAIGGAIALAFGGKMLNTHTDDTVVAQFDKLARYCQMQYRVFPEFYRELLIASQVTAAVLWTRETFQFQPASADRQRSRSLACPAVGVIPSEQVRVVGNDMFGTAQLAYRPYTGAQEMWLQEFFDESTSPGRKAEMRKQDPVLTTLLMSQMTWDDYVMTGAGAVYGDVRDPGTGRFVYRLNPLFVSRISFPKGQWPYPRPLLTRNFPLLEAKRLLNIMDYGLLEGGANFLVVVKKGSDARPAMPTELENLRQTVRRASRTGVIVGDHRLNVEIITPDLAELLNERKRNLIGRKLAAALLRIPNFALSEATAEAAATDAAILERVITADRGMLVMFAEDKIYEETANRNDAMAGPCKIWFEKIVLQGLQFWTDMVLKLRDRGDLPRKYGVEMAGFDYDAAVEERRLEKARGDDKVLTAPPVPFSGAGGPQDLGGGRPPGGSSANGAPGSQPPRSAQDAAAPRRVITATAGETVRSIYEEASDSTQRVGEYTFRLLEEYADGAREGRITSTERDALGRIDGGEYEVISDGGLTIVPVNGSEELSGVRVLRLADGLRVLVGHRYDGAVMARALSFRQPEFRRLDAEEFTLRLGWEPQVVN